VQIAVPESRSMLEEVPVIGWFLVAVIAVAVLRGVVRVITAAMRGDSVGAAMLGARPAPDAATPESSNRYVP